LPPEVLARYQAGEFGTRSVSRQIAVEPAFDAACKQNADRFDVNERGTIVEKATGKPATGITACRFASMRWIPRRASR
jgi:hypothetical protein